jgi:hypothetical protein
MPETLLLAVVNCEPTVRVFSILFASFYLFVLPTFVDNSIVADTTDIIKCLWTFIYNDFGGKLLYFLKKIGLTGIKKSGTPISGAAKATLLLKNNY